MASKITVSAVLATLCMGASLPELRSSSSIKIIGGSEASAGQFPSIASLSGSGALCGATLINADTVITAAHCFEGITAPSFTVRAGSLQRTSGGVTSKVSKLIPHPGYNSTTVDNDFAIAKLSTPIAASNGIEYAKLPASGSDPSGTVSVAGWGLTEDSTIPDDLLYISVPVIARDECAKTYSTTDSPEITDNMFCAGTGQDGKDACSGDSGGPVFGEDGALIGVVSWGNGCAEGYPGVYARVSVYIDWINGNI